MTVVILLGIARLNGTIGQEIRIDHVITVVSDLDNSIYTLEHEGFVVKQGRMHDNGLINAHVKFPNQTSYELMALAGPPTDEMSRDYQELLAEGEGGVFVALTGMDLVTISRKLSVAEIEYLTNKGPAWSYITFPKHSGIDHFFIIEYHDKTTNDNGFFSHGNNSVRIKEVMVEGGNQVLRLLECLGLNAQSSLSISNNPNQTFLTQTGSIIVIPIENTAAKPRVKLISFSDISNKETKRVTF